MNLPDIFLNIPSPLRRVKFYRLLRKVDSKKVRQIKLKDGTVFFGDLDDIGVMGAIIRQSFDDEMMNLMQMLLGNSDTLIDVGANYGLATFSFAMRNPANSNQCYLFEANPQLCELMRKTALLYKNTSFHICNAIVSDTGIGKSFLQFNSENTGASFVDTASGDFEVSSICLDQFLEQQQPSIIGLIKLDVEGYEMKVLQGASAAISKNIVKALIIEVDSGHLHRAGSSVRELIDFLLPAGFYLFHWRQHDFEPYLWNRFQIDIGDSSVWEVNGRAIRLAKVDCSQLSLDRKFGTDLLAIHKSSPYIDEVLNIFAS